MTPPVECLPLSVFYWIRTSSLTFQILMRCLPWLNWPSRTIQQIKIEINVLHKIQIAFAKTGFWIRYPVHRPDAQLFVEIFIRTVE